MIKFNIYMLKKKGMVHTRFFEENPNFSLHKITFKVYAQHVFAVFSFVFRFSRICLLFFIVSPHLPRVFITFLLLQRIFCTQINCVQNVYQLTQTNCVHKPIVYTNTKLCTQTNCVHKPIVYRYTNQLCTQNFSSPDIIY